MSWQDILRKRASPEEREVLNGLRKKVVGIVSLIKNKTLAITK